jgi:NADP-reducing hydrogenase subunit HndB
MSTVKSLEDLKRIKEQALEKRKIKATEGNSTVVVGMGTCGIAAGARETMKAILGFIEDNNLSGIIVTQTGCIGLCEREPIIQVSVGEGPKVTYGKVTPEVAEMIMKEHVLGGKSLQEYVVKV